MKDKIFKLSSSEIKEIIIPIGSCVASDKITVEGLKVGYMYREESDFPADSGWRFFSGTEDDDYINNPDNLMIYDVNTIVNYDLAIVKYLNSGVGVELERVSDNTFQIVSD